jgi:hypothetical protein
MVDFLKNLLAPYLQGSTSVQVPTSLADISGFDLGQKATVMPGVATGPTGMASTLGATLAPGALQSLVSAASQYGYSPGYQELSMFGPLATFRTYAQQAALGGTPQNPGGSNPNATTAGNSLHEQGLAVDLPGALQTQRFFDILRALGWFQLEGEPWHWSYQTYG